MKLSDIAKVGTQLSILGTHAIYEKAGKDARFSVARMCRCHCPRQRGYHLESNSKNNSRPARGGFIKQHLVANISKPPQRQPDNPEPLR